MKLRMKKAARKFFGTDGVRGQVGKSPMTPDFLVRLGFAAGRVLANRASDSDAPEVLVGKDTRLSGYMVESALEAGLSAAGANVLLSGPLPTSAVSYLTQTLRLRAGVVISASHNPHGDNGVKFFDADGGKLDDSTEAAIEKTMRESGELEFKGEPGRARRLDDAAGRYIEFCKKSFPPRLNLFGMRVVADCANGAAYHIAPPVFHELGAEVIGVGISPDGLNINRHCGALSPELAAKAVKENKADFGVALDGDGDRALLIDSAGRRYDGDALLYIIAMREKANGRKPAGVVGTTMSNSGLQNALAAAGIDFVRASVGDRYVGEMLRTRGWTIGGEPSGHIILPEIHNTGDGIIAALQAAAAMRESGKTLAELCRGYRPLPQEIRGIKMRGAARVANSARMKKIVAAESRKLVGGRIVLRPSGTESVLRLMVEGENRAAVRQCADRIQSALMEE